MYIMNILLNNTDILLNIFYITTIFCGISILIHKNAVISIIYFMLVYVNSSLYLYYIGYSGMPLLLILIYVGAIAILFLFILTLINVKELEDEYKYSTHTEISNIRGNNNIIIFINIFLILILYIYNYSKDIIIGSQLYNILDKIILNIKGNPELKNTINNLNISDNNINYNLLSNSFSNIYFNSPILDYPLTSATEVMIIGESMYTTYCIVLLILGIILVISIIAAIAILFNTHNCIVKTSNLK